MEFVPAIYEHAARLIRRSPWEVSRNEDLLVQAHVEAYRMYLHSPVVPGIDLYNVEAEAYGSEVCDAGGVAPPAVSRPACTSLEEILALPGIDPERSGRIPLVLSASSRCQSALREAHIAVPLSGPFSIAANLIGGESLLMAVLESPHAARGALERIVDDQLALVRAVAERNLDVILFESAAAPPLLSPQTFRTVEAPPLRRLVREARRILARSVKLIIGGNTLPVLDDILSMEIDYLICPAETDQASFMKRMEASASLMVRVNMNPGVFLETDPASALREADRVRRLADRRMSVCIGSGVLPYEAIPETVLTVRDYLKHGG